MPSPTLNQMLEQLRGGITKLNNDLEDVADELEEQLDMDNEKQAEKVEKIRDLATEIDELEMDCLGELPEDQNV